MKLGIIINNSSTCSREYLLLHLLLLPKRTFSDMLKPFSISVRVKRALFESSFLKKTLISDKMELLLYIGIGLLVFLVLPLKYTNSLWITEVSMPFFYAIIFTIFLLAKLEHMIIQYHWKCIRPNFWTFNNNTHNINSI